MNFADRIREWMYPHPDEFCRPHQGMDVTSSCRDRGWMSGRVGALCLSFVRVVIRLPQESQSNRVVTRTGTRPPPVRSSTPCPYRTRVQTGYRRGATLLAIPRCGRQTSSERRADGIWRPLYSAVKIHQDAQPDKGRCKHPIISPQPPLPSATPARIHRPALLPIPRDCLPHRADQLSHRAARPIPAHLPASPAPSLAAMPRAILAIAPAQDQARPAYSTAASQTDPWTVQHRKEIHCPLNPCRLPVSHPPLCQPEFVPG